MEEMRSPSTGGSEEEAPGNGGTTEHAKNMAEVAGDGAIKGPMPEEEAASHGAAKRPKPEDEEAGDDGTAEEAEAKLPKPEEPEGGDGAAKPEEEEDDPMTPAEYLAWLESLKHPKVLGFDNTSSTVPDTSSEEELRAELKLALQYERLMAGGKLKKVKEWVEPAAIEECLRMGLLQPHPAGRTAVRQELPKCLEHMPEGFRAAFLRNQAVFKRVIEYQQDIVDQYRAKGYAEVDAYVVE